MSNNTNDTFEVQPFEEQDRVRIEMEREPQFHGREGLITGMKLKRKPKYGKAPGWWATVLLNPPEDIKRWEVEIHCNNLVQIPLPEDCLGCQITARHNAHKQEIRKGNREYARR
jgi:hypothetical protein